MIAFEMIYRKVTLIPPYSEDHSDKTLRTDIVLVVIADQ